MQCCFLVGLICLMYYSLYLIYKSSIDDYSDLLSLSLNKHLTWLDQERHTSLLQA